MAGEKREGDGEGGGGRRMRSNLGDPDAGGGEDSADEGAEDRGGRAPLAHHLAVHKAVPAPAHASAITGRLRCDPAMGGRYLVPHWGSVSVRSLSSTFPPYISVPVAEFFAEIPHRAPLL